MTHGRKAYGMKKKVKRDHAHFIKKKARHKKTSQDESMVKEGHPSTRKDLEKRLKKPRRPAK